MWLIMMKEILLAAKAKRTADRTGEDAKIPMYGIADAGGATKEMLGVIRERQWIERHVA